MTQHRSFPSEPWAVRETELNLSRLAESEAIFALSNGHIGLRANLEEGEPHGLPGTYLNSFYETHQMAHAEAGYGYPEVGQTLVNVTNGKIIRLLVDDEPFDVRYGRLRAHERVLDLRAGVLRRRAEWVSPAGQAGRVSSVRLLSFFSRAAAGPPYEVEPPRATAESSEDLGRVTVATELEPGQRLRLVRFLGYGWSSRRSLPSVRDQVEAALAAARRSGWGGVPSAQRDYLDDFWHRADVELEGDDELQQAVRFALFHTLQASARAEGRAIPAKGLTGPGYDGHTFWDTETFVLQPLTYTVPHAAGDALRWRHATLSLARERAKVLGLGGAAFPWRTIRGQAISKYWPASTAAFHINADIAAAIVRYLAATGDDTFEREVGLELLAETARLWLSLGHHDTHGRFRIDGVTGPDEYSAIADNNVYTNLMAQNNLQAAADAAERYPERAGELGVDPDEAAAWRAAARAMFIPYDEKLGVHPQAEQFTEHAVWDFARTGPDEYPLMLHHHYFDLYRKQVVKQADLVLALYLRGDAFSPEDKARNFEYYESLTVRDSSLSAFAQAVVAAEVGHLELAYDYFGEAALLDLGNLHHNTRDGVHLASLAGAWIAAVAGFGGMRDHGGSLSFAPPLPERLSPPVFRLCFRGRRIRVEVDHRQARYTLLQGAPLDVAHHGRAVTASAEEPVSLPIPPAPDRPAP